MIAAADLLAVVMAARWRRWPAPWPPSAAAVASKAWAAAQWLFNAALTANPIGLVVIAIVALVAAFVLAWKTQRQFRNIVDRRAQVGADRGQERVQLAQGELAAAGGHPDRPDRHRRGADHQNWGRIKSITSSRSRRSSRPSRTCSARSATSCRARCRRCGPSCRTRGTRSVSGTSNAWSRCARAHQRIARCKDIVRNLVDFVSSVAGGILASATKRAGLGVRQDRRRGQGGLQRRARTSSTTSSTRCRNTVSRIGVGRVEDRQRLQESDQRRAQGLELDHLFHPADQHPVGQDRREEDRRRLVRRSVVGHPRHQLSGQGRRGQSARRWRWWARAAGARSWPPSRCCAKSWARPPRRCGCSSATLS